MTVYIEKPSVNLREELASLRNQGGYEEQQFYFDGLVTNGTFDTDTSGWSSSAYSLALSSNALQISYNGTTFGTFAGATGSLVTGRVYQMTYEVIDASQASTFSLSSAHSNVALNKATGTHTATFTQASDTTTLSFYVDGIISGESITLDNISVFETDGTDVVHRMPKGWVPLHVYEDGLLQREGAANDYTVVYDGFDYYVKPAVAPSATTQTCVIGVRK